MAEPELRNCPFCGDNQQLNYVELSNGLHYIECARCGAAPHRLGAWNRETAVKYWNSVNRWISVEDALPEAGMPVLIYACKHRVTAYYDNCKNLFRLTENDNLYYIAEYVTHWMPLPESPEKE